MKSTNLFFITQKESPADAEIVSHKLMLRAGLIRKLASGLYTWLPLGLKVLRKIEDIIRDEMHAIGAQEILMPNIQPAELWQETERWDKVGPLMLKMTDRHGRQFCFGPTHEEVVTDLIRRELKSYKQLPLCLYQIQTKFRDEIRPRFGVMRAREFLMKDAYSFHMNDTDLQLFYDKMYQAYTNIFSRLGLKFRAVLADSGAIGGHCSHEFHVLADSGEDLIVYSDKSDYAANMELASALPSLADNSEIKLLVRELVSIPEIKNTIEQADFMQLPLTQMIKTLLVKGQKADSIIGIMYRADNELNHIKLEKIENIYSPLTLIDLNTIEKLTNAEPGFIGPFDLNIPFVADLNTAHLVNFCCGTNQTNKLYKNVNWQKDLPHVTFMDIRNVQTGDLSPDGLGTLSIMRGIEVGHIFQLGTKYSTAMNAKVLNAEGQNSILTMGCYGIGVSRIIGAAIEQNNDEQGIIWPPALAPFQVVLIAINFQKSQELKDAAESLYQKLKAEHIDVLWDDRAERPGVLFADMELIGIPHRLVLSEKTWANASLEYKKRGSKDSEIIQISDLITFIKDKIYGNRTFS